MRQVPNVHDAEPIPAAAKQAIEELLQSGDLFRYNSEEAPVSLLLLWARACVRAAAVALQQGPKALAPLPLQG